MMFAQTVLIPAFAVLGVAAGKSSIFLPDTDKTALAVCDIFLSAR
jgi:hypothetical protein